MTTASLFSAPSTSSFPSGAGIGALRSVPHPYPTPTDGEVPLDPKLESRSPGAAIAGDTLYAAALRGTEMGAEIVLKGTKVDGVYTEDPKRNPNAQRYAKISFDEAINKNLKVMDATALTLCRDQKLPINVFNVFKKGALRRVVLGEDEGTLVHV